MIRLIEYCRARGTASIVGEALRQNRAVQTLAASLGFTVEPAGEPETVDGAEEETVLIHRVPVHVGVAVFDVQIHGGVSTAALHLDVKG